MSDQFIGEIRIFAGTFAPRDWALCDGSLINITSNSALFSILGVTYGGNGQTTFGLPDLRGCAPLQQGTTTGLTPRVLGEEGGTTAVTLLSGQLPRHTHPANATTASGTSGLPAGKIWGKAMFGKVATNIYSTSGPNVAMSAQAIGVAGGNLAHNNMPPYLCLNFIIALRGIFPQREEA